MMNLTGDQKDYTTASHGFVHRVKKSAPQRRWERQRKREGLAGKSGMNIYQGDGSLGRGFNGQRHLWQDGEKKITYNLNKCVLMY